MAIIVTVAFLCDLSVKNKTPVGLYCVYRHTSHISVKSVSILF